MSHLHRFYIPPDTASSDEIALIPAEAHHASHVVRTRVGDRVELFDGCGRKIDGSVSNMTRHDVIVSLENECFVLEPFNCLTLIQGWIHKDKNIENIIRRGTEIGIRHFRFFRAQRSDKKPKVHDKWKRIAIETCKQCGRMWLPDFEIVENLAIALDHEESTILIATSNRPHVQFNKAVTTNNIALIVGPEGDFSDEELHIAEQHDAVPVSLGTTTYRSEVAAVLASALIMYELGEFNPDKNTTDKS